MSGVLPIPTDAIRDELTRMAEQDAERFFLAGQDASMEAGGDLIGALAAEHAKAVATVVERVGGSDALHSELEALVQDRFGSRLFHLVHGAGMGGAA